MHWPRWSLEHCKHGGSRPCPTGPMSRETAGVSGRESGREGHRTLQTATETVQGAGQIQLSVGGQGLFPRERRVCAEPRGTQVEGE